MFNGTPIESNHIGRVSYMEGAILALGGLFSFGISTYFEIGGLFNIMAVIAFLIGILDVLNSMDAGRKK